MVILVIDIHFKFLIRPLIGNLDSGIQEFFDCEILNPAIFYCGIRDTTQGIRNTAKDWNQESGFQKQRTWNPESSEVKSRILDFLGFSYKGRLDTDLKWVVRRP